jgi:hypothetical protein
MLCVRSIQGYLIIELLDFEYFEVLLYLLQRQSDIPLTMLFIIILYNVFL